MKKIFITIIVSMIIILIVAFFVSKRGKFNNKNYQEIEVKRGDVVTTIRLNGSVEPRNRLPIKPQIAGRVEEILVVEGQKVKKGDIIAYLSSTDRAALLDIAKSQGEEVYKKWQDVYKPTPVIAPIDGFIIARNKEPGQTVTTNDNIVVMADELIVKVNVDETDLRYVKLGQNVSVSLDAYPEVRFNGIVEHIAYESTVVNNVTVYEVWIKPVFIQTDRKTLYNEKTVFSRFQKSSPMLTREFKKVGTIQTKDISKILRSGMSATVEIIAEQRRNVLTLPVEAITDTGKEKYVVVKKEKAIEKVVIETGLSSGKIVEVISGLNEGDIVLVPTKIRTFSTTVSQSRGRYYNPMSSFFRR